MEQEFIEARLKYEQKTAAIYQTLIFLNTAIDEAQGGNEALQDALNGFKKYIDPHDLYPSDYFCGMLFKQLISEVELYLTEVIQIVIREYPHKIGSVSFDLSDIVDSDSIDKLVEEAAAIYLNHLMYKKPTGYLQDLGRVLSFETESIEDLWANFVEAKARRDVGVHNDWIVNEIYQRKTREVGIVNASFEEGDSIRPSSDYLVNAIKDCDKLVQFLHVHLMDTYP